MRWEISTRPPANWGRRLRRCGGTYFHSPAVVRADGRGDTGWYATLRADDGAVAGVAVATPRRCRLGLRPRHASLPSLPAVSEEVEADYPDVVSRLGSRLRQRGIRELQASSFAAPAGVRCPDAWTPGRERLEYRVPLAKGADDVRGRLSSHHERYVRQGENAGYEVRPLAGDEALAELRRVVVRAAERSQRDGDGFSPPELPDPGVLRAPSAEGWGGTVYAAYDDGELLSGAYLGWAGGRAFYVSGGSTQAGYDGKAAFWMHPAVMLDLEDRGFREYNLGGTPAGAEENGHPQHGLHRFKSGFGPEVVRCRGASCTAGGVHMALHRAARGLRTALAPTGGDESP